MKRQLARLMPPDFLLATPSERWACLPRYLKALRMRHAKLTNAGLARDRQKLLEIAPHEERLTQRQARHAARGIIDPALISFRWLLEEYRVSLFAQELKTAQPISARRLDEAWDAVKTA